MPISMAPIPLPTKPMMVSSDSNVATVAITVNPVNDAPTAVNDTVVTNEDTAVILNILTNDSDPENAPLTSTIVQGPANGTLSLNAKANWFIPQCQFQWHRYLYL